MEVLMVMVRSSGTRAESALALRVYLHIRTLCADQKPLSIFPIRLNVGSGGVSE
jgi:hypothetical protein